MHFQNTPIRARARTAIVLALLAAAWSVRAEELPGAGPILPGHPNLPNGYELAAHFYCGTGQPTIYTNGVTITLANGQKRAIEEGGGPIVGEATDPKRVEIAVAGLDPEREYVVGFTWWDHDRTGRRESVEIGLGEPTVWNEVLPATVPLAFHADQPTFARIQLPAPKHVKQFSIAFVNKAGTDVGVNELWLLRKSDDVARKCVAIVTGDDYAGHHWRVTGPELAAILREDQRLEVWIVESPAIFASPAIDAFDAAVVHFKDYAERLPLGSAVWTGLDRYVAAGHGLVVAHFGCGAFQEWPGFVNVAGRIWDPSKRGHDPYGPFHVRVVDAAHPIAHGMTDFDTADELYTCLVGEPQIHILYAATSCVDHQEYPMGFVVENAKARVFHSSLGHDVASLRYDGTRELYRRAVAWAAGLPEIAK